MFHPDRVGDPTAFNLKVESTFKKCLDRQVTEGVYIHNSTSDHVLNSKSEFLQPSVSRVSVTREVRGQGSLRIKIFRTEFFFKFFSDA